MITQAPSGRLTSVEQSLVDHVGRGELLDLAADDDVIDEAVMRSWGPSRTCRASVIRDILRGRLAADPDPHGLRLRGARISGRLDLENLITEVSFELDDCFLEEGFLARDARLSFVGLTGCHLEHPTEPPLSADRLACRVLFLTKARIFGHAEDGAVNLGGAHINGSLDCDGAVLHNDSGAALDADRLQVGLDVFLRGGFTATGAGDVGAVNLRRAHIGGQLECDGAVLRNDSGPALDADGIQVSQEVFLRGGFTATGAGDVGAVNLLGARIGGQLSCIGAELANNSGPALNADDMQVSQGVLLRDRFTASGAGGVGAVNLRGARISGQLDCTGAKLYNNSGPALKADAMQVGQYVFLRDGFTATGTGNDGAVNLVDAHIGTSLECDEAVLANDSGPALNAEGLQVGQNIFLRRLTATGGGNMTMDLTDAQVGGTLVFDLARLEHATDSQGRIAVDGLTYAGIPERISAEDWLGLLRDGTTSYAAQPYQQMAAGYRALGNERQAREILIAQRDDELTRTHPRRPEKLWGKITKVTLGYGYQPWRALLFLAAVVVISCLLAVGLGSHGALTQTSKSATPGQPCTVIQQVSVGLGLNLPVGASMARQDCDLTKDPTSVTAAWLTAAGWTLQLFAWVFAALFIAGFTSAVRKT